LVAMNHFKMMMMQGWTGGALSLPCCGRHIGGQSVKPPRAATIPTVGHFGSLRRYR